MKQVSLIMTFYNRAIYLKSSLESVLLQTYPNLELIIIDDGSTDSSLSIAQDYAQKDSRLRVVSTPHLGRVQALKVAHQLAKGEYLAWIDSDDLISPQALQDTVTILNNYSHIGMVYTDYIVIDSNSRELGLGSRCKIPYSKERLLVDFMTFHFRLIRRNVFERAGGIDPFFEAAIDYDLCLRLSEITEIYHLPRPLYYYRVHADSISLAQKQKQIYFAHIAVKRALTRRGLDPDYEIILGNNNQFILRKKGDSDKC